jgi:hypothetical protein
MALCPRRQGVAESSRIVLKYSSNNAKFWKDKIFILCALWKRSWRWRNISKNYLVTVQGYFIVYCRCRKFINIFDQYVAKQQLCKHGLTCNNRRSCVSCILKFLGPLYYPTERSQLVAVTQGTYSWLAAYLWKGGRPEVHPSVYLYYMSCKGCKQVQKEVIVIHFEMFFHLPGNKILRHSLLPSGDERRTALTNFFVIFLSHSRQIPLSLPLHGFASPFTMPETYLVLTFQRLKI